MNEHWPKAVEDGLIPTDDAMGIMTEEPSPAAEAFIELAGRAGRPLLEVGAAYGKRDTARLARRRHGDRERSLGVRARRAGVRCVRRGSQASRPHASALSEGNSPLGDGSLSGGLAAQVLHFFDGPTVERPFQRVLRWLEPGGAWYVVVMTPSLGFYRTLRPEYGTRARRGERWPRIFDPRTVAPPDWKGRFPPMVHLSEKDVLRRCAEEAGFTVETPEYFCFPHFPARHRSDGHEFLTLTARRSAA